MIAAIGDIHGNLFLTEKLVDKLLKNYKINKFIFLGDLIDRGSESKQVINFIKELEKNYKLILLLGNHEDMMLDYIFKLNRYPDNNIWFGNGGDTTIKSFSKILYRYISYGDKDIRNELKFICQNEIKFLRKSKIFYVEKISNINFFFSHAGIKSPNISPLNQPDKDSYIWERNVDDFTKKVDNFIFIHGHTPVFFLKNNPCIKPYINKSQDNSIISINIDTGCAYGGPLTSIIISESGEFEFITVN